MAGKSLKSEGRNCTRAFAKGAPGAGRQVALSSEDMRVIRLALAAYANDMDRIHFESGEQARAHQLIERSERW